MYEALLKQIGLNDDQTTIYQTLLKNGPLKVRDLTLKLPIKRQLVYKLLDDLTGFGLVEKEVESGSITLFRSTHPSALQELVENRAKQLTNVKKTWESSLPGLISDFNLISGKPGVRFFEGVEGLKTIYDDILRTGQNFYLIRSKYEPVFTAQIVPVINDFIAKRVKQNIKVTALTPDDTPEEIKKTASEDAAMLYERTWINQKYYDAPVEIDIYGNKVAILSFSKELIGLIIESPQIARALKCLFVLGQIGAKQLAPALATQNDVPAHVE